VNQSLPNFFSLNLGETALNNTINCLPISQSVPEIFAIKFESCPKSHQILDVFAVPIFTGRCPPQKLYQCYHPHLGVRHVAKYPEATPTTFKVIDMHLLNFLNLIS